MKTIPVEQLDPQLTKALEQQNEHEAIGLTKDAGTVAWVLRVPEALRGKEADLVFYAVGPVHGFQIVVRAKHSSGDGADAGSHQPVFGAGRGTLTIVSEDDEYLKDFQEYMQ